MSKIHSIPFTRIGIAIFKACFKASWIAPSLFTLAIVAAEKSFNVDLLEAIFVFLFSGIVGYFISVLYTFMTLPIITSQVLTFVNKNDIRSLFSAASLGFFTPLGIFSYAGFEHDVFYYVLIFSAWVQAIMVLVLYCQRLIRLANRFSPYPLNT